MRRVRISAPILSNEPGRWRTAFFVIATSYLTFLLVERVASFLGGFATILMVVFLAWLLAFILSPAVGWLEARFGWSRGVSVGVVYAGTLVGGGIGLLVVGTLMGVQFARLTDEFPETRTGVVATLRSWQDSLQLGTFQPNLVAIFDDAVGQVQRISISALGDAPRIGIAVVSNMVLVLILSLYMVLDSQRILRALNRLIPDRYDEEADLLERSVARAFGGFLRAQVILAGIQALLTLGVAVAVGLPYLFLIVAVSTALMLVPFFGPPLALVPPIVAIAIYQPEWLFVAGPVLLVVQTVLVNWLQPKLMHGALGLHPLLVLVGLLVGAQVAGVWGALFGIPVIAVLNTFGTYIVNLATLEDTAEVEADEMLAEARREAPADAEMEEIIALAADKAEEAHEEARDEEEVTDGDTGEVLERLAETTDDLRETSELTREAAYETRNAARETRDAAVEIREAVHPDDEGEAPHHPDESRR
jgi:predicted PurR-regulated permease PerM